MREKSSTKHLVEFFNASPGEEYYWMASADNHLLFKSDPHMLDDNSSLLKKNTDLKDAIKQAKRVCGIDNTSSSSGSNLKRKTSPAVVSSSSNATTTTATTTATTNNDNTSSEGVAPTENLEPKTKKVKSSSSNITPPPQSPFHNRSSSSSSSPISSSSNNNNTTKVTLTDDELSKVLTQLDKAIEDKNSDNIKDFIDFIHDNCNEITVEQLKKIKIGKCVHKLRKSEDEQVAMKAKDLVKIWTACTKPNAVHVNFCTGCSFELTPSDILQLPDNVFLDIVTGNNKDTPILYRDNSICLFNDKFGVSIPNDHIDVIPIDVYDDVTVLTAEHIPMLEGLFRAGIEEFKKRDLSRFGENFNIEENVIAGYNFPVSVKHLHLHMVLPPCRLFIDANYSFYYL